MGLTNTWYNTRRSTEAPITHTASSQRSYCWSEFKGTSSSHIQHRKRTDNSLTFLFCAMVTPIINVIQLTLVTTIMSFEFVYERILINTIKILIKLLILPLFHSMYLQFVSKKRIQFGLKCCRNCLKRINIYFTKLQISIRNEPIAITTVITITMILMLINTGNSAVLLMTIVLQYKAYGRNQKGNKNKRCLWMASDQVNNKRSHSIILAQMF